MYFLFFLSPDFRLNFLTFFERPRGCPDRDSFWDRFFCGRCLLLFLVQFHVVVCVVLFFCCFCVFCFQCRCRFRRFFLFFCCFLVVRVGVSGPILSFIHIHHQATRGRLFVTWVPVVLQSFKWQDHLVEFFLLSV